MTMVERIILAILIGLFVAAYKIIFALIKIDNKLDQLIEINKDKSAWFGKYNNICDFDDSSLHPSIMREFHVDVNNNKEK